MLKKKKNLSLEYKKENSHFNTRGRPGGEGLPFAVNSETLAKLRY